MLFAGEHLAAVRRKSQENVQVIDAMGDWQTFAVEEKSGSRTPIGAGVNFPRSSLFNRSTVRARKPNVCGSS
jgi:hypothetical protein